MVTGDFAWSPTFFLLDVLYSEFVNPATIRLYLPGYPGIPILMVVWSCFATIGDIFHPKIPQKHSGLGNYTVVKVDGDGHSKKVANFFRGHDKPRLMGVATRLAIYFPGGIQFHLPQRS